MNNSAVSALDEAHAIYTDPDSIARRAKSNGARICGYIGSDVPEELILAAGYVPIRVRGDAYQPLAHGDRYGHLAEPVTRSILARLADGTYDYLDALIIDHSIDAHALLFFNLRQVRLMLPEVRLPRLHFFDLLHLSHLTTERYNRDRVRELADTLGRWSGCAISDEAISREIASGNAHRAALAEVAGLRSGQPPRLSGSDALALIGCAMLMPRRDFAHLLKGIVHDVQSQPPLHGRRLFITGSNHESPDLYRAIEQKGSVIVGDDHDWGDRYFADPLDETAHWIDAITDRAMFGAPAAAKYGLAERIKYITDRVGETGAEMLLSINRSGDDAALWEFPDLKAALERGGIACARVEHVPYDNTAAQAVENMLGELR